MAISLLVNQSYHLSSHNPTLAEKIERAEVWAEVLSGIIPESDLQECFERAFKDHESGFVVNAYDLKAAWDGIEADRAADRPQLMRARVPDCPRCYGSNIEIVFDAHGKKLGARPNCDHRPLEAGEWLAKADSGPEADNLADTGVLRQFQKHG